MYFLGKKLYIGFLITILIFSFFISPSSFAASTFKDVPMSNYAYDAVNWAMQEEIVSGYRDKNGELSGFFGPFNNVTEAQFAKMLVNYFEIENNSEQLKKNNPNAHWSDDYYNRLALYEVPLNGYFDDVTRNEPVKRGVVAQAITKLLYGPLLLDRSIEYLLMDNITTGQNEQYKETDIIKYFGADNFLTRAQVVTFFYRINEMKKGEEKIAINVRDYPTDGVSLHNKAKNAIDDLDESLNLHKYYIQPEPIITIGQGNINLHEDNRFTDILKSKLRENDTWKSLNEEGYSESIYVYNKTEPNVNNAGLMYSVHYYDPSYDEDLTIYETGQKYKLVSVYTVDLISFTNRTDEHIQNLYDYGILTKKVDNGKLKEFLFSRFQVKKGEYIDESKNYNKSIGIYAHPIGRQMLTIQNIIVK